jgi:ribosome-associated translation inhibitor RaiA
VTTLQIAKTQVSQKALKELYGAELKDYAAAHNMADPLEERNRCWRLFYADAFSFHLDSLPCMPEDARVMEAIIAAGVPRHLAVLAVAITDKRHPHYAQISADLFSSNPRGFADWFEECARSWALPRLQELVKGNFYAAVEDVPAYEFKTPLQQGIQILKRHRDIMFRSNIKVAPISMIITNLAARAYEGEQDLYTALANIVDKMPQFVQRERPRVPNPANPAEDYADKWSLDRNLERSFWQWHTQAQADLKNLKKLVGGDRLGDDIERIFGVTLSEDELRAAGLSGVRRAPAIVRTPVVTIPRSTPRPWGDRHLF